MKEEGNYYLLEIINQGTAKTIGCSVGDKVVSRCLYEHLGEKYYRFGNVGIAEKNVKVLKIIISEVEEPDENEKCVDNVPEFPHNTLTHIRGKIKKFGHNDEVRITSRLYDHKFSMYEIVRILGVFVNNDYRLYIAQSNDSKEVGYISDEECELYKHYEGAPMFKLMG